MRMSRTTRRIPKGVLTARQVCRFLGIAMWQFTILADRYEIPHCPGRWPSRLFIFSDVENLRQRIGEEGAQLLNR